LESRISEISNFGASSTMIGGGGVEHDQESALELLVPTLKHGKLGVQDRDCQVIG